MAQRRGVLRVIKRSWEEVCATHKIACAVGIKRAIRTFIAKIDIQVMARNGENESPAARKRLINKHEVMNTYFEKTFRDFTEAYDYDRPLSDCDPSMKNRIWICWWQGIENAPDLVKACVSSIQKHAAGHVVTIITEENYRQFVNFPQWVEDKYQAGMISRTNYSDLLRLSLLAKYGGMWLDATFFCRGADVNTYFENALWSIKRPDYKHASVAGGYFAGYSLCCAYDNRWVFATIRDFFLNYWKENNMLVDYLLIDYMIVLVQRKDLRIAELFADIPPNNAGCDELVKILNKPYDEAIWNEMTKETYLFKLSWKQNYVMEADGRETFYAKLIKGEL